MSKENKYYVYVHRDLDDEIFYVGSGSGYRKDSKANRSRGWNERAKSGFKSEVLCTNLNIKDARELEELLISMFNLDEIVNVLQVVKPLCPVLVLNQFYYCDKSPSGLRWKVDQPIGRYKHRVGDIAGGKEFRDGRPHRYRVKPTNTKSSFAVHRLVWALHNPLTEGMLIDHIDGNPFNNKIENLREVSFATNSRNMKKSSANISGVRGVHFKTNKDGHTYWSCTWRSVEGKSSSRSFMIEKYGYEEAFTLACMYREVTIRELKEQGCDYTDRHIS